MSEENTTAEKKILTTIRTISDLVVLLVNFATGYKPVMGKNLGETARKFIGAKLERDKMVIGSRDWLASEQSVLDAHDCDVNIKAERRSAQRYINGPDWYKTLRNKRTDLAEVLKRTFDRLLKLETELNACRPTVRPYMIYFEDGLTDAAKRFMQALQDEFTGGCIKTFEDVYDGVRDLIADYTELTEKGEIPQRVDAWLRLKAGKVAAKEALGSMVKAALSLEDDSEEDEQ